MIQSPPFCIQIELVEGCNLRCSFCGLNGIRGNNNDLKFMSADLAERIVRLIKDDGWNSRIEFAMHGEPTLNPQMLEIVEIFRRKLRRKTHLMMTSNGGGLVRNPTVLIDKLLESLNVLALDWYDGIAIIPKILKQYQGDHQVIYYPENKEGNPHRRRKIHEHDLVVVKDIAEATSGTHATLNNHCGCGAPKNDSAQGKRCAKPFRELSVRWDGSVALCCNDWRGHYKCGNVWDQSLEQIWQGPAFRAARRKLYHGMRDFGPCDGCDALSYRPGLLPDQKGKLSLPEPTKGDQCSILEALAGLPYTKPVPRLWELDAYKK